MQHKPTPPAAAAEEAEQRPPAKAGSCEIILFPGFDITMIMQTPDVWDGPVKPKVEPSE
jgi:hypothetical protein